MARGSCARRAFRGPGTRARGLGSRSGRLQGQWAGGTWGCGSREGPCRPGPSALLCGSPSVRARLRWGRRRVPLAPYPPAWQHPFLNIFRYFRVDEWKRSSKEGDVSVVTDKALKSTVYRIQGSVSASNYILLPKTSTQSLGLTGRYLYVLFRPLPTKHFAIHLDLSTEDGQVIRVSFSSLFKEFRSSATWLQFPFVFEARTSRKDLAGVAPPCARWTCLQLDLCDILSVYLSRRYGHLKSVRLCANLLVRNLYTSDLCFDPTVSVAEARRAKLPVTPVPREMAFPVPKGESWHDRYVHVRFPRDNPKVPSQLVQKSDSPIAAGGLGPMRGLGDSSAKVPMCSGSPQPPQFPSAPSLLPEASLSCEHSEVPRVSGLNTSTQDPMAWAEAADMHTVVSNGHVLAHKSTEMPVALDAGSCKHFLPDPILRLKGVIGFGGHSTKWALWTKDGTSVVYPCHAVIVVLHIDTGEQRFFLGHTDKVSALALDGSSALLASAQAQPPSVVRLWDFQTGGCLSLFQSPMHTIYSLSFSGSGALLYGVGKDGHGRTVVVAWSTSQVGCGGQVVVLAKVHTDLDIQAFRVAFFDGTRMASCGRGSLRLWRLRGGTLRSCSVDLGEYCTLELTDLAFVQAEDGHQAPLDYTLYVCSRNGHILEIDHQRMAVRCIRRLLPSRTPGSSLPQKSTFSSGLGIAISSLSISPTVCAVGSEDGCLRLWPLDFSSLLLEAEQEGPVSSVCFSPDGLRVLSTTSSGHLGFLDIPSQEYTVLARSHMAPVLAISTERSRGQLATVSLDHTVRIWDLATLRQLYDCTSSDEAPSAVALHPKSPAVFCGFSSGAVRSFSLETARVLAEHTCHHGTITGLVVTPDGNFLFSSCSQGSLAQYSCAVSQCPILCVAVNAVCQDAHPGPNTLAVSGDSRLLAFVGPSKYTVTVMDSASLNEVRALLGEAPACLSPHHEGVFSKNSLLQLPSVRPIACSSLALSEDAHFLLTATSRAIRVWNYWTQADSSCQVGAVASRRPLLLGASTGDWGDPCGPRRGGPGQLEGPACGADRLPGQLEGAACGADGLPRQQVPVPSQGPPPRLDMWCGFLFLLLPPGTFCLSNEEELCKESQGPPVLVERETGGAGSAAWGSVRRSQGLFISPLCHSWSTRAQPLARPDSYKHFTARYKASTLAESTSFPPEGAKQLRLRTVVGYNGNGRANMVWKPDTGFFAYTCGRLVVVEDLHSGAQKHWLGHPEEISTLALSHNSQVLASASCCSSAAARCQIRIWDVPGGLCQQLISHHNTAVQALAFSPDDKLLVSLGDYGDCTLALWSTATYELVSSACLLESMHGVAFNPWDASELTCVGTGSVAFWFLQQRGADVNLQMHREPVPEEVGAVELTALCYGAAPLLYCGSSSGQVCVWDTCVGRCFLAWEADDGEIGVLLCLGSRLVSGSNTKRLRLWSVGAVPELRRKGSGARSSSVFMERELTLDGAVVSASFDSSMDMGIVGTTAGTLWYVSWAEGSSIRLVSGHRSKVNEVVFSPDESHCATGGEDGSVRVWSLASMELVIQFQVLNQSCLCLAWSPSSCGHPEQQQVVAGYSDGTLRVFSIARTSMELKMQPHRAALMALAFSTDGQTILSGDKDGVVAVSRLRTGITFRVLSDHQGAPISTIQSTSKKYGDLGVEGTDLWLAASGDQRISVWASDWLRDCCDLLDWLSFPAPATLETSGLPPPSLAAFCPWDGALLVCVGLGAHEEVVFYSLRQKQVVEKMSLPFFAMSLSLSPGARFIAIGFAECTLRLLDCMSGVAQDFTGHDDSVHLCRFTPSARLLFTAAHNEILVWEVMGHGCRVTAVLGP
uniref:WD repeat-containing protein 90 n=1 Tax=Ictidomys tridecemlineatus TaxID=43179 RepID=I3M387_ICTTR